MPTQNATAQIIAIGSEMLTPEKIDTNSLFLTEELNKLGISLTGILLTLAFRYYSGIPGTTPNLADTHIFIPSMSATYWFALIISVVPLLTSLKMRKENSERLAERN